MSDRAIVAVVGIIAAGLVLITGIVVSGEVLGEPTKLIQYLASHEARALKAGK